MRIHRRRAALTVLIGVLVVAAGCSKIGGNKSTPAPSRVGTVTLNARLTLEGALSAQPRYTSPFNSTGVTDCKSFAARRSTGTRVISFVPPLPPSIVGQSATWIANIGAYNGPGVYGIDRMPVLRLTVRTKPPRRFSKTKDSQAQLKVNKDGSGTFSFTDLADSKHHVISGKVRWTCSS